MAHVQRRTTKYGMRYEVRWRDRDGTHRQKSFRTYKDAKAFKPLHEADTLRGEVRDYDAAQVLFREVAESWLACLEVKDRTRHSYRSLLDTHVLPAFGVRTLGSIEPADCREYVARLKASGLSPATIRHAFTPLRRILAQAVEDRALRYNAADGVKLPTARTMNRRAFKPSFFSAGEVAALADEADWSDPVYGLVIRFAAYTGLRAGEIAGLNVADVDLLRREVRVERTRRKVRGGWVEDTPKSERSTRTVPVPVWLSDDLAAYLAQRPLPLGAASPLFPGRTNGGYTHGVTGDDSLTPGRPDWSEPWERDTFVKHVLKPALARAGLPAVFRFHDLRHTYASLMAEAGKPMWKVSRWMGHSSVHITDVTYTHLFQTRDADEMADIARPTPAQPTVTALRSAR